MTMTLNCCCCTRSRKKKTYKKSQQDSIVGAFNHFFNLWFLKTE